MIREIKLSLFFILALSVLPVAFAASVDLTVENPIRVGMPFDYSINISTNDTLYHNISVLFVSYGLNDVDKTIFENNLTLRCPAVMGDTIPALDPGNYYSFLVYLDGEIASAYSFAVEPNFNYSFDYPYETLRGSDLNFNSSITAKADLHNVSVYVNINTGLELISNNYFVGDLNSGSSIQLPLSFESVQCSYYSPLVAYIMINSSDGGFIEEQQYLGCNEHYKIRVEPVRTNMPGYFVNSSFTKEVLVKNIGYYPIENLTLHAVTPEGTTVQADHSEISLTPDSNLTVSFSIASAEPGLQYLDVFMDSANISEERIISFEVFSPDSWCQGSDFNRDGAVDLQDFGILKDSFGAGSEDENFIPTQENGDANLDGMLDLQDFGTMKNNFGRTNCTW